MAAAIAAVLFLHFMLALTQLMFGFRYQLYLSGSAVGGALPGKGAALDFGAQSAGGTYTVIASNIITSCSDTMNKTATIVVNPVAVPSITTSTPATSLYAQVHKLHLLLPLLTPVLHPDMFGS